MKTRWTRRDLRQARNRKIDGAACPRGAVHGPDAVFPLAADDTKEDIFLLSSRLPRQLEQKVRTMLAHMRDADRIYESKNK